MMSSTGRSSGSAVAKSLRGQERLEVGGGDLRGGWGGLEGEQGGTEDGRP